MRTSTSTSRLALALASVLVAACGSDPSGPGGPGTDPTATVSGMVSAVAGTPIQGATVKVGSATTTTGADGAFELADLPVGNATIITTAAGFDAHSESVVLAEGGNTHDVVLTPTQTATVSGVVTAQSGAVVEGATVKVGNATTTTGADGSFELQNLPVGNATMITTAPRYDPRTQPVNLSAGANAHDVVLTPQTLFTYGNAVAYLPLDVAEYKAAIVFLPGLQDPSTGLPLDSRGLVRGTVEESCSIWCTSAHRLEVRSRALQLLDGDVALIGTTTLVDNPASYETLLQALTEFGTQSLHPELANIPIVIVGHSMGGCTAYGFSRVHAARVAGFLTMKGGCHNQGPALSAATVPGYFLIGALDAQYRADNITAVFEAGRAGTSAPWAISIDAYGHSPIFDFDGMFDWIAAVLDARLPLTPGGPLRSITETAGWLGNRSNGAIATHACYTGDASSASWLPTEEAARDWQRMAGGSVVVTGC